LRKRTLNGIFVAEVESLKFLDGEAKEYSRSWSTGIEARDETPFQIQAGVVIQIDKYHNSIRGGIETPTESTKSRRKEVQKACSPRCRAFSKVSWELAFPLVLKDPKAVLGQEARKPASEQGRIRWSLDEDVKPQGLNLSSR
jgi:hypothetical protein